MVPDPSPRHQIILHLANLKGQPAGSWEIHCSPHIPEVLSSEPRGVFHEVFSEPHASQVLRDSGSKKWRTEVERPGR